MYHISKTNLDGKTLNPRIPDNFFTKNGYEDGKIPRVSFSKEVSNCIMGVNVRKTGEIFFVHEPVEKPKRVYHPKVSEVPDVKITKEIWVLDPVELKCVGTISIGRVINKPLPFSYGDKTAELWGYNFRWINH